MSILPYLLLTLATIWLALALTLGPRRALALWKRFGHAMGDILARVVLTVFYFTVMVPFALIARRQDVLGLRRSRESGASLWRAAGPSAADVAAAERQF